MVEKVDVVIVGGGAAGFFAAIACAEAQPRRRVRLLEASRQVLSKVKISGGGRCNLTHHCFDPQQLIEAYPRGGRELRGPFHKFQPRDTIAWFEDRGVPTKAEPDGRVFPVSDDSASVIGALLNAADRAGVDVRLNAGLKDLKPLHGGGFHLRFGNGEEAIANQVLIATGGLKAGPVARCLEGLGHTITPLAPSLFTFDIDDARMKNLAGLVAPQAMLTLPKFRMSQTGPALITHWGLSGPATLKLSAWAARELRTIDYSFELKVNWVGLEQDVVRSAFGQERHERGKRQVGSHPLFGLPKRLWQRVVESADIDHETSWGKLPGSAENKLLQQLTDGGFAVSGKSMNKEEFVTCGGVALPEVDFRTMESRKVPGLHFAGEVLDIDAITGGFNFQAAWTTGYLAGRAMAAPTNETAS